MLPVLTLRQSNEEELMFKMSAFESPHGGQFTVRRSRHLFRFQRGIIVYNTWLHTRACKYNLRALGTYFECEGAKCTQYMEMLIDQRTQNVLLSMALHLRTHLTNRKWKPTESDVQHCYNSDELRMNCYSVNNLLEFHIYRQP